MSKIVLISVFVLVQSFSNEVDVNTKTKGVRYKDSKRIDFESLLVEGERKKPEMSVVTGNLGEKDSGLLKFRENFVDMMTDDFGGNL